MKKGINAKRCSCNRALDDLIDSLAERIKKDKYFKNMSTAGKLINLQSATPIPEIADCDCDAGLVIKMLRGGYNEKMAKNNSKAITVFISPIGRKIKQKIRSIFPRRC